MSIDRITRLAARLYTLGVLTYDEAAVVTSGVSLLRADMLPENSQLAQKELLKEATEGEFKNVTTTASRP